MSVTKDGFYNIEGKMFEVVHGVEGDCLILGDEDGGTRISGPKPWGGGQVTKTFFTQEKYGPIERLEEENAKLRELASGLYGLLELYDRITGNSFACETKRSMIFGEDKSFKDVMCELGIEVDE